jgi:PAS domain S-box-containing protein
MTADRLPGHPDGDALHQLSLATLVDLGTLPGDRLTCPPTATTLHHRDEVYRLLIAQAKDYAIFSTDVGRCIETWSPGAEAVFGWSADAAIGRPMDIIYTLEDRAAGVPEQEVTQAQAEGRAPNVRWHLREDGSRIFIDGMIYARRGADGVFLGVFKIGQDVTARLQAEDALRAHEEILERRVAEATTELRTLSRRLLLVQEEERRKLALELHDEIGQVLTGLSFQLAAASEPNGEASLAEATATVQALTEQVRQVSLDLRPAVLDHYGLLAAVEWYIARYQFRTGITVHLRQENGNRRLAPEVEIAAFRVVQEGLTNIARYAGVREAWVTIFSDGVLLVIIKDKGQGFDVANHHHANGLAGMRERVELLGGTFELESVPGQGTTITAELPIEVDSEAAAAFTSETHGSW